MYIQCTLYTKVYAIKVYKLYLITAVKTSHTHTHTHKLVGSGEDGQSPEIWLSRQWPPMPIFKSSNGHQGWVKCMQLTAPLELWRLLHGCLIDQCNICFRIPESVTVEHLPLFFALQGPPYLFFSRKSVLLPFNVSNHSTSFHSIAGELSEANPWKNRSLWYGILWRFSFHC